MTAVPATIPFPQVGKPFPAESMPTGRLRLALSSMAPALLRRHAARHIARIGILMVSDGLLLMLSVTVVRHLVGGFPAISALPVVQFVLAGMLGLLVQGCYGSGDQRRDSGAITRGAAFGVVLATWALVWHVPILTGLTQLTSLWLLATALLVVSRRLIDGAVRLARPADHSVARALVVGPPGHSSDLITHPALGESPWCHLVAFLDPGKPGDELASRLAKTIRARRIDTVIIAGDLTTSHFTAILDAATTSGCHVLSCPRVPPSSAVRPRMIWRNGHPIMELTRPDAMGAAHFIKRLVDITVATVALIVLAPLLLIIALLVAGLSSGPILFRQARIGQGGRTFHILKFRSMRPGAEAQREELLTQSVYGDRRLFKVVGDPRITPIGNVLRRTSLDELPQLWNVLRGDMSLVGPRPPLPSEVSLYEGEHYARFDVKPGITGPWQVNGRNTVHDFEEVVQLETAYIQRWSNWLDFKLLLRTVPVVLSGRGAH